MFFLSNDYHLKPEKIQLFLRVLNRNHVQLIVLLSLFSFNFLPTKGWLFWIGNHHSLWVIFLAPLFTSIVFYTNYSSKLTKQSQGWNFVHIYAFCALPTYWNFRFNFISVYIQNTYTYMHALFLCLKTKHFKTIIKF